jgi:vancomycin permeability regulator SanA
VDIFVVMGAAVWREGLPSGAMRRRVSGAYQSSLQSTQPFFLVSGGLGKHPPSEAEVMRELLIQFGVPQQQIQVEDRSSDTVSSIQACAKVILATSTREQVVVCTDTYHVMRCRWLFFLYGIRTKAGQMESGRKSVGLVRWIYYWLREVPAFFVDTALVGVGALRRRLS